MVASICIYQGNNSIFFNSDFILGQPGSIPQYVCVNLLHEIVLTVIPQLYIYKTMTLSLLYLSSH